jgi:hypothetical protein
MWLSTRHHGLGGHRGERVTLALVVGVTGDGGLLAEGSEALRGVPGQRMETATALATLALAADVLSEKPLLITQQIKPLTS